MSIRIAIPEPTHPHYDDEAIAYNQRSLPQYLEALRAVGLTPIPIPLDVSQQQVAQILTLTAGILLPGSGADVDPQQYNQPRHPATANPDPARAAVDELLLQDAFNLHKPILAICYGTQTLNVWRGGTLVQDIPTQITPIEPNPAVNHAPGRTILEAHPLQITPNTLLAQIAAQATAADAPSPQLHVNSSHHQSIQTPGDNLTIAAISPHDNVVEAIELNSPSHWVLAVQWHPERSYASSPLSQAIFHAFSQAARQWTPRKIEESVLQS